MHPLAPRPANLPLPKPTAASSGRDALARYARRGPECAFANVRLLGRVVGTLYDERLRPSGLRASQLALLWAIVACEPAEQKALERVTRTDQTTLSRTIDTLRAAGLVTLAPGADRRVRLIRLSARGRRAFLRAMPLWEAAQAEVAQWLSLRELTALGKAARRIGAHDAGEVRERADG